MIDLYGNASPNLIKVLFMFGETELPFRIQYVNIMAGENFDPVYTALNPNAKIPTIVDQEGPEGAPHTVFESGAILVYLAEKTGRFFGRKAVERSEILQWLMFQMSDIGPMFGQAVHFRANGPAPWDNEYPRTRYFTEAARLCEVLDQRLSQSEHLGGPVFSIADMATFPWLRNYPEQLGIDMTELPNLQRWRVEVEARPGYQRIRDTVDSLIERGLQEQQKAESDALDRFFRRGRWAKYPDASSNRPGFGEIKP